VTFSLCVHEPYVDGEGTDQDRFGVAVTSRLAGVGTLCPFANEHGAVATQSLVNVELGRRGVEYLADGLAVEDALEALLDADDGAPNRQLHGVDADGSYAFSGEESKPWFGHHDGSSAVDGHYTVAGNLLTGEDVVEAVADAYESTAPTADAGPTPTSASTPPRPRSRTSGRPTNSPWRATGTPWRDTRTPTTMTRWTTSTPGRSRVACIHERPADASGCGLQTTAAHVTTNGAACASGPRCRPLAALRSERSESGRPRVRGSRSSRPARAAPSSCPSARGSP
jgi:hypothetical protein